MPPSFGLIARCGAVTEDAMWEVFDMGCGFVAVVAEPDAEQGVAILAKHHPGAARIGAITDRAGQIERG